MKHIWLDEEKQQEKYLTDEERKAVRNFCLDALARAETAKKKADELITELVKALAGYKGTYYVRYASAVVSGIVSRYLAMRLYQELSKPPEGTQSKPEQKK